MRDTLFTNGVDINLAKDIDMETNDKINADVPVSRDYGPRGTELPIIASSLVENIYTISGNSQWTALEKALDELKECGFNGFFAGIGVIAQETLLPGILQRVADRNMFVIISSDAFSVPSQDLLNKWAAGKNTVSSLIEAYESGFKNRITNFLNICHKSKGFGGVLLADEPTKGILEAKFPKDPNKDPQLSDFNTPKGSYYCLRNRYNIIREYLHDNEVLVVNLVGDQNEDGHVTEDYSAYLDEFENISDTSTKPDLWSFDYYPITEHNYLLETNYKLETNGSSNIILSQNGVVDVGYKIFYDDLRLFQERAKKCNGMYWSNVRSMEFSKKYEYYPVAIEPYLRFAIFSSLAMGCRGITYWTYHQRGSNEHELFLSAPLDMQGRKTPAWFYAKKLNEEIRRFNYVFRNSKLSGFGHIGKLYDTGQNLKFPFGRLTGIRVFGDGYLVTRLTNGTSLEYIVIVNHSVTDYQEITSFFSSGTTIYEITPNGRFYGTPQQVTISSSGVNRLLPPGGYLIYQYTK